MVQPCHPLLRGAIRQGLGGVGPGFAAMLTECAPLPPPPGQLGAPPDVDMMTVQAGQG